MINHLNILNTFLFALMENKRAIVLYELKYISSPVVIFLFVLSMTCTELSLMPLKCFKISYFHCEIRLEGHTISSGKSKIIITLHGWEVLPSTNLIMMHKDSNVVDVYS